MIENEYDKFYFYELDYENKLCVDCKGSLPDFASINNGVLVCRSCAERHAKLGYNISYIRGIQEPWDDYLISFIQRGGNSRFIRMQKEYKIEEMPIEEKYTTRIAEYYRLLIKSEVEAEAPPQMISKEFLLNKCDLDIEYFPEFKNYEIFKGNPTPPTENKLKQIASTVYDTVNRNNIPEKLYNGSVGLFKIMKATGGFIYETTKPAAKYLGKKAIEIAYNYVNDQKGPSNKFNVSINPNENKLGTSTGDTIMNSDFDFGNGPINNYPPVNPNNRNISRRNYNTSSEIRTSTAIPSSFLIDDDEVFRPNIVGNHAYQVVDDAERYPEITKEKSFEPVCEYSNTDQVKARMDANNILFNFK